MGKSRPQELEKVISHESQEARAVNGCTQLLVSFSFRLELQLTEMVLSTHRVGLYTSSSPIRTVPQTYPIGNESRYSLRVCRESCLLGDSGCSLAVSWPEPSHSPLTLSGSWSWPLLSSTIQSAFILNIFQRPAGLICNPVTVWPNNHPPSFLFHN